MTRRFLVTVFMGGMAVATTPASATEWVYCSDVDSVAEIGFLLGTVDAFMPAGATMRHETRHWTTNEAYGDGAVMTVGQGYGDDTMLMVDLFDEAVDAKIAELRESGLGMDLEGSRGTLWGALNAVLEFVDHHHRDRRLSYGLLGDGMNLKVRAFKLIGDEAVAA